MLSRTTGRLFIMISVVATLRYVSISLLPLIVSVSVICFLYYNFQYCSWRVLVSFVYMYIYLRSLCSVLLFLYRVVFH
jgi:hypothetical protein